MALLDITLPIGYGSKLVSKAAKKLVMMDDNSFDINSLSSNEVVTGVIQLVFLTEAQKDASMTFYTTNKDISWTFYYPKDGETYTLYFRDPAPSPDIQAEYDPPKYFINFAVVGTKN